MIKRRDSDEITFVLAVSAAVTSAGISTSAATTAIARAILRSHLIDGMAISRRLYPAAAGNASLIQINPVAC
jgi:hypothetical protein